MIWLLDSNIVIDHLDGRLTAPLPDGELCVSIITRLECLSRPDLDEARSAILREFLATLTSVGIDDAIAEATIAIRQTRAVKLPDAIILATARTLGATLLTNDDQLLKVEGVNAVRLAKKP